MKLVTKLTVVATLATFMFAGMNLTWGNAYSQNAGGELVAKHSWGVWMDLNDSMAFGWEGTGLKAGFDGPAGMQMRLGFDPSAAAGEAKTSLGVSRAWWTSTGDGWGTNLSTAVDWVMTDVPAVAPATNTVGDFMITMNLGFGF